MAERVCPWWLGYFLISPFRRWVAENPRKLLGPYIQEGSTVLEPGPGMGFFTLPMARIVGRRGRVIAVDIQPQMLENLDRRARKAGVEKHIQTRLATPDDMNLQDLRGTVDFVWAFAVVHEMPSVESFFVQATAVLKPGGSLFLAEPKGHVTTENWQSELNAAQNAGLTKESQPPVRRSLAALFRKV